MVAMVVVLYFSKDTTVIFAKIGMKQCKST